MWQIGNVKINNQVCLAPMAGVGNSAFRRIIKELGAGLIFCEMVSDKALYYGNEKTQQMLLMDESERPIVQQIFGNDVESFVVAAKYIEENMKPDIIDINMGCPVKKIAIKSQAGAALMKNPDLVFEIVKAVKEAVNIPITVKIRSGWDSESINAVEIAKVCEKAGASAITVHPRTRVQGYSGSADWEVIKQVKSAVKIPVIGNGDIKTPEDAKRMLELTNCDAVMIGRAAFANPFVIRSTKNYLEKGFYFNQTLEEQKETALKHLDYLSKTKDERVIVLEFRNHLANYLKGFSNAKELRFEIMQSKTIKELKNIIKKAIKID